MQTQDPNSAIKEIKPGEFEKHGGYGTAKKWKNTVRVEEGTKNDSRVGKWLSLYGLLPDLDKPRCGTIEYNESREIGVVVLTYLS